MRPQASYTPVLYHYPLFDKLIMAATLAMSQFGDIDNHSTPKSSPHILLSPLLPGGKAGFTFTSLA
jgi:hypothetical protein